MAITITGSLVIDETSGTQNPADTSDSSGNDIAGGAGVLPAEFDAALTALSLSGASASGVAVSGATADNSTGSAMITGLPADLTDVSFTDSAGAPLDGDDSGLLTTDGTKIFLYTYSGDNNVLLARKGTAGGLADPAGAVVFAAYLDTQTVAAGDEGATSAKVWMVQFESMFNPVTGSSAAAHDDPVSPDEVIYVTVSSLSTFSLEGAPSGQNLFLMYGDPDDSTDDAIVVTASDAATGGTVNTGQAGGGTTIGNFNQMLDAGEALTFTFVTGANSGFTVPNLTQTEADSEDNILFTGVKNATAASFAVVQTQPSSRAGTLTFEAFTTAAEPGTNFLDGYIGDGHVDIETVVIKNSAGTVIETNGDTDADNLTISLVGGVATIIGVKAGYTIEYTTDGNHQRVEIANSSPTGKGPNGADFDIGDFQLISTLVTPTLFDALVFEDAGPSVDFGNVVGTGTETAQVGFWSMDPGADGLGADALDIVLDAAVLVRGDASTDPVTSFVFDELTGSPDVDGSYLFGGTLTGDFDDDAGTADTDRDFTLTAFDDGHYELVMEQAFGSIVIIDTADGALGAGGPDPVQTLTIPEPPATPITDVVFFSAKTSASEAQILSAIGSGLSDPDEATLEGPPLNAAIDPRAMNVSTAGIGVDNNLLQGDSNAAIGGAGSTDESFVVNPEILVSSVEIFIDNSVQGYNHTGGERLYYKAFYEDGTDSDYILVTNDLGLANKGQDTSFVIDGGGKLIDAVQLTMAKGDIKIPNIVFVQETEVIASDIQLTFTATVTDGENGDTASDSFSADLYANELSGSFDFVLTGTATEQDSFNVDLSSDKDTYQVTAGFEVGSDLLVLIGDATATVQSINTSGADTVVTIAETGGVNTTTVTVVGVDLTNADIVFG